MRYLFNMEITPKKEKGEKERNRESVWFGAALCWENAPEDTARHGFSFSILSHLRVMLDPFSQMRGKTLRPIYDQRQRWTHPMLSFDLFRGQTKRNQAEGARVGSAYVITNRRSDKFSGVGKLMILAHLTFPKNAIGRSFSSLNTVSSKRRAWQT